MLSSGASRSIEDLRRLMSEGVITEEEFRKGKERLQAAAAASFTDTGKTGPTLWQRLWWNPNATKPPRMAERSPRAPTPPAGQRPFMASFDRFNRAVFRWFQWLAVVIVVIVCLNVLSDYWRVHLPGASRALFWGSLSMGAVCALLLSPPVFFRLSVKPRWGVYALLIAFFFVADHETQVAVDAYARTPDGAAEAALNGDRRRAAAAEQAQRHEAEWANAASERQADYTAKAEGCLSSGNHLPALEEAVKGSLHNPDSYQFIGITIATARENDASLFLGFRGENGFGAIRSGTVKAVIDTRTCAITDIGEPQID